MASAELRRPVGLAALVVPAAHILSDLAELVSGGFSPAQLALTYLAFLATPFVMLGLHAVQEPRAGWLGLVGALAYGAAFVFYAGTALVALVGRTPDYTALVEALGPLYPAHGALMVLGAVCFGLAVVRARVLPRWTGIAMAGGAGANLLASLLGLPEASQLAGSAMRNVAVLGMGAALLGRPRGEGSR